MVATSQPLATQAGLRALERGGNAIDAALAATAVLCVVEPMSTGVGGDCFALVWRDGELTGLNASGRAPAAADPDALGTAIPMHGPLSITAPGAVAGWAALAERHGRLGLDVVLADAIDIAERGFAVTPVIAGLWAAAAAGLAGFEEARRQFLPAPRVGPARVVPRAGRHPAADRPGRPGGSLPRARGRGHLRGLAAHARRPRPSPRRLGGAAAQALPRRRGVRDPAERPGRRRAPGARDPQRDRPRRRRSARARAPAGRGDEARVRGRRAARPRRPPAGALPRRRLPRGAPRADRPGARGRARGRSAAAGRHGLPVRRRRGPQRVLADPERLPLVRVARRRAGHRRRAPQPRALLHARGRPSEPARARQAPVPHDHPGPAAARRRPAGAVRRHGRAHAAAGTPAGGLASGRSRPRSAGRAGRAALATRHRRARRVGARARGAAARPRARRSRGAGIAPSATPTRSGSAAARPCSCATAC